MAAFYLRTNGNTKRTQLFGYMFEEKGNVERKTLDNVTAIKVADLPSIVKGDYLVLIYLDGTYTKFLCTV